MHSGTHELGGSQSNTAAATPVSESAGWPALKYLQKTANRDHHCLKHPYASVLSRLLAVEEQFEVGDFRYRRQLVDKLSGQVTYGITKFSRPFNHPEKEHVHLTLVPNTGAEKNELLIYRASEAGPLYDLYTPSTQPFYNASESGDTARIEREFGPALDAMLVYAAHTTHHDSGLDSLKPKYVEILTKFLAGKKSNNIAGLTVEKTKTSSRGPLLETEGEGQLYNYSISDGTNSLTVKPYYKDDGKGGKECLGAVIIKATQQKSTSETKYSVRGAKDIAWVEEACGPMLDHLQIELNRSGGRQLGGNNSSPSRTRQPAGLHAEAK